MSQRRSSLTAEVLHAIPVASEEAVLNEVEAPKEDAALTQSKLLLAIKSPPDLFPVVDPEEGISSSIMQELKVQAQTEEASMRRNSVLMDELRLLPATPKAQKLEEPDDGKITASKLEDSADRLHIIEKPTDSSMNQAKLLLGIKKGVDLFPTPPTDDDLASSLRESFVKEQREETVTLRRNSQLMAQLHEVGGGEAAAAAASKKWAEEADQSEVKETKERRKSVLLDITLPANLTSTAEPVDSGLAKAQLLTALKTGESALKETAPPCDDVADSIKDAYLKAQQKEVKSMRRNSGLMAMLRPDLADMAPPPADDDDGQVPPPPPE